MKSLSKITILLENDDRELLRNVDKMLENIIKMLNDTDIDSIDLDSVDDYELIENAYFALKRIYDEL